MLDTRLPEAFGGGHIPEALNVGLGSSFPTWAGTVLPTDTSLLIVGHIDGATYITKAKLPGRLDEVPAGPLAVICGSGYRSSASASLIASTGRADVINVLGGMSAWHQAQYPTTS